jgi:hypothetical protein
VWDVCGDWIGATTGSGPSCSGPARLGWRASHRARSESSRVRAHPLSLSLDNGFGPILGVVCTGEKGQAGVEASPECVCRGGRGRPRAPASPPRVRPAAVSRRTVSNLKRKPESPSRGARADPAGGRFDPGSLSLSRRAATALGGCREEGRGWGERGLGGAEGVRRRTWRAAATRTGTTLTMARSRASDSEPSRSLGAVG